MHRYPVRFLLIVIAISAFGVLSQWEFWPHGLRVLGFNSTLFWLFLWLLLLAHRGTRLTRDDWIWFSPIWLIIVSFSLYENLWLKQISFLLVPVLCGMVYAERQLAPARQSAHWSAGRVLDLVFTAFRPLRFIGQARRDFTGIIAQHLTTGFKGYLVRVLAGIGLLVPAAIVVIALLSSADPRFSIAVDRIVDDALDLLDLGLVMKTVFILLASILTLATLHAWNRPDENPGTETWSRTQFDSIIAGILLAGILLIYCLFLYFQMDYLLMDKLPIRFEVTEKIVKSGFWQLFCLSVMNVMVVYVLYRKTNHFVQNILRVFILASALLLLSASWRIGLYIYWYGLSHEKFFAGYTCLYALLVFGYLSVAAFARQRRDILRFIAITALWGYALATWLPIEKTIFATNVHLSKQFNSRINLYELTFMSLDVLDDAQGAVDSGVLRRKDWEWWLERAERRYCKRGWLESNISQLSNCR